MDHPDYIAEKFTRMGAWIDLLLLANHDTIITRIRGIRVEAERGQIIISERDLCARWKWSRDKVRKYLSELQYAGQIMQWGNNVTTRLTILNYDKYQATNIGGVVVGSVVAQPQKNHKKTIDHIQQITPQNIPQKNSATVCNTTSNNDARQPGETAESTANDTTEICGTICEKGTAYIQEYKKNKNIHTQYSDKLVLDKNARERVNAHEGERAQELLDWVAKRFPTLAGMPEPLSEQHAVWLLKKYDAEDIRRLLAQMDSNRVGESGKKNAFAILINYIGRDFALKDKKQNAAGSRHYTYNELCDLVTSGKYRSEDFRAVEVDRTKCWVLKSVLPAGKIQSNN